MGVGCRSVGRGGIALCRGIGGNQFNGFDGYGFHIAVITILLITGRAVVCAGVMMGAVGGVVVATADETERNNN